MPAIKAQFTGSGLWIKRMQLAKRVIHEELAKAGERGVLLRNKVIATWNDKPEFTWNITTDRNRAVLIVTFSTPTPSGHHTGNSKPSPNKKWYWLDRGTKRKFVIASKDFSKKTKPNVIASYPGSGTVSKTKIPQKGIPKGNWDIIVNKRGRIMFERAVSTGLKKSLARKR